MDSKSCILDILKLYIALNGQFVLKVVGNSMFPSFCNGDKIKLIKIDNVFVGDIVVFVYEDELLVHRILRIKNNVLYCKGDNSFRIEKIKFLDIVGKVVSIVINNLEVGLAKPEEDFIELSYAVGREFIKQGYNKTKLIQSKTYLQYQIYIENMIQLASN